MCTIHSVTTYNYSVTLICYCIFAKQISSVKFTKFSSLNQPQMYSLLNIIILYQSGHQSLLLLWYQMNDGLTTLVILVTSSCEPSWGHMTLICCTKRVIIHHIIPVTANHCEGSHRVVILYSFGELWFERGHALFAPYGSHSCWWFPLVQV